MKILLTLRQPLFPADTGGKIRSLNIFSRLARRAEIHALSFADAVSDSAAISRMKEVFASYTAVSWLEPRKYSVRFYKEVAISQISPLPYFLARCYQPSFRSVADRLARREHFDLLFCDFLHTAAPMMTASIKPKVVFEHNLEFQLRKRKWQLEKHPLRKVVFAAEWRKTRPIETSVCTSFDHVLTVSEEDRNAIQHEFGIEHVSTLPTGVDSEFFCPATNSSQPGRLAFVGSMDWDPNEDGIVWFLERVYPFIWHAVPNASFTVVGRNPSPRLRRIAARSPAVELTGWVPDVRPYLSQAEVVVVPLRIGGGTRIKIPEAMAMAKAVVSTPIGAEGLPFQNKKQICIAEQPQDFAQAVIELLKDTPLRKTIEDAARKEVMCNHSWEAVVDKVEEVLDQVMLHDKKRISGTTAGHPVVVNV